MRLRKTLWLVPILVLSFVLFLTASIPVISGGTWQSWNNMNDVRSGAAAAPLQDGRVLIVGGTDANGPVATADLFGTDGLFSAAAAMQTPRWGHTATVLSDGRVLVTGGTTIGGGVVNTAEIYDPTANSWSAPVTMVDARVGHTASMLSDGRVLLAGGHDSAGNALSSLEIFDSASGKFLIAGSMSVPRMKHAAATLGDGRVAIIGGTADGTTALVSIDIYDPNAGTVSVGPVLSTPRMSATATTTLDGKVAVIGGNNGAAYGSQDLASTEILDPASGQLSPSASNLVTARSGHQAFLLPQNNAILVLGGSSSGTDLNSAEIYYPWADSFQSTGAMSVARPGFTGNALSLDGRFLAAGGTGLASTELYGFGTVKTDAADYAPGSIVTITGSGWQPGETVTLTLLESPLIDTHPAMTAVADALGNIVNNQFSPDVHDVNVRFYLTAVGASSGIQAQNTFTDATINLQSVSPSSGPTIGGTTITITGVSSNEFPGGQAPYTVAVGGSSATNVTVIDGSHLSAVTSAHIAGTVNVSVTNKSGTTGTLTNIFTYVSCTSPSITGQPSSAIKTVGDSMTLSVTATGTNPTYQWRFGGSPILGATGSSYTISSIALTDAGSYDVVVTNGCGTVTSSAAGLMVNKKSQAITFGALSDKTYGDTDFTVSATATSGLTVTFTASGQCTASGTTVHIADAGNCTVTAHQNGDSTTWAASTDVSQSFNINKAHLTVKADDKSKTYDGSAFIAFTTTISGFVNGENSTVVSGSASFSGTAVSAVNAGSYTITPGAGTLSATNYDFTTFQDGTLTINKRDATWTTNSNSKTYGDADPNPLTTGNGNNFVAADNVSATYSRVAGEAVLGGPYHITATLSPAGVVSNYNITNPGADFTINPRTANWTTNPNSKTYGDTDPNPLTTGNGNNFVAADNVSATFSRAAGETVLGGPYHIMATLGPAAVLSNYNITNNGAEFSINKRDASVSPNPASKTYGDPDPAFSGTLTNFVAADSVKASYSRTAGETVAGHPYTISATLSPVGTLGNYNVTYNTAEFTINKRDATWTTNPNSKTYGDADPNPLTTGNGNNFVAADNVSATYTRAAGETVAGGPYHITATLSAAAGALENYNVSNAGADFTISKRNASVTPNAAGKTYGDPDPAFSGTLTNFVAADSVTASYTRTAGETVAGNPYTISAALSPVGILGNYSIMYNTAAFTMYRRDATWTTNPNSKTYGDADPNPLTTGNGNNFVAADNVSATYSRVAGEAVLGGPYHITATLSPAGVVSNYNITNPGADFTINPRTLNASAHGVDKQYDGTLAATVTFTDDRTNNDSFSYTYLASFADKNVGTGKLVNVSGISISGTAAGNYKLAYTAVSTSASITPAPASVAPNPAGKIYGSTDPLPLTTGTLSGFIPADGVMASYSRTTGEAVGTYTISAMLSPLGALANYAITYNTANFAISKASTTVSLSITPAPNNGSGSYVLNTSQTFSVTVAPQFSGTPTGSVTLNDGGSAIATISLSGGSGSITSSTLVSAILGSHSLSARYNGDGNFSGSTSAINTFSVGYAAGGICDGDVGHQILQPINVNGTSVWKQGSTVPAKFRVCDVNGTSVGTSGVVTSFNLVMVNGGTVSGVDETVNSTTPDTAFRWDPTAQQWIFNISTKTYKANTTYVFQIVLNDNSIIGFQLGLR